MKTNETFKLSSLAIALALAFPISQAMADEVEELTNPNLAEAALKVQNVNTVNPLYREYSGLNHKGVNGSLDVNVIQRTEEGRWFNIEGRDLGLRTQEFKAGIEKQGDWAVSLGYDQIPHFGPFKIDTAVSGIGSNTLNLANTTPVLTAQDQDLKTERTATSLTAKKFIYDNLVMNFSFKNEDKKGTRLMGANGNTGVGGYVGMLFTPEPIDSTHQQFEASLDYSTKKFQISAGYYGSFFKNNAGNGLTVNYGTGNDNSALLNPTAMSQLSLAPNNHANEFYVSGGYNFSDDTRGTLKVAKTYGVQNASFVPFAIGMTPWYTGTGGGRTPNDYGTTRITARSDLGGEVETTNVAAALTSRITKQLSVRASWAYEDQKDKTPRDLYFYDHGVQDSPGYNNPESLKTNRGKLEATYRLPTGYAVTAGYDYDQKKYPGMEKHYRDEVTEQTARVELRKAMSETLNGSIRLAHSERDGSAWAAESPTTGGLHWIYPTQFADRKRDKARVMLDWEASEALSVQFAYEYSNDDYTTRPNQVGLMNSAGLQKGQAQLYSFDVMYRINDNWKSSLWYSHSINDIDQASMLSSYGRTCTGSTDANTCVPWQATLGMKGDALGAGVEGRFNSRLDVGFKAFYARDVNRYDISKDEVRYSVAGLGSGAGILPDTVYKQTNLHLFGKYALAKTTTVRLDYIWDKRQMDDYTWSNWTYSDGTKVYVKPSQTTQIVGVTLIQSF